MATLNPYLNFNGNTEEAFEFYKSVFGGQFTNLVRFKDMPGQQKLTKTDEQKIMHVALPIGKENTLMGTDTLKSQGHKVKEGNNIQLSITAKSEDEANKIFNALAKGGKTIVPQGKAPWGSYYGQLNDKYGVQWMVNYDYPKTEQAKTKEREFSHN